MKKCKNCQTRFECRFSTLEKYCWDPHCKTIEGLEKLEQLKKSVNKLDRQRLNKLKDSLMSSSELKKKVQIAFNTFIRQRDKNQLCISCQKPLPLKYDAGHFYSVGNYPAIRYNLDNCHAQCIHCNHHRGGNIHEYKIGLIKRIGEERVEALTEIRNISKKYNVPELKEMLEFYKNSIKK